MRQSDGALYVVGKTRAERFLDKEVQQEVMIYSVSFAAVNVGDTPLEVNIEQDACVLTDGMRIGTIPSNAIYVRKILVKKRKTKKTRVGFDMYPKFRTHINGLG